MRKEMKKNNKMLLALAVVAALAMVSIAGVALSDNADAANRNDQMMGGTTVLDGDDSSLNARFYILNNVDAYGMQFVTIDQGYTISGTIAIGTADKKSDGTIENYVEYASVTLTGVSNAVFTLLMVPDGNGGFIGIIMVGDAASVNLNAATPDQVITNYRTTTGTFEVTSGTLLAGAIRPMCAADLIGSAATWSNPADDFSQFYDAVYNSTLTQLPTTAFPDVAWAVGGIAPFTGTIKAAGAELTAESIYGLAVGVVDGKGVVYGEVVKNALFLPWKAEAIPLDDPDTSGDESQIYDDAGIPSYSSDAGVVSFGVPANNEDDALMVYIPAANWADANVTFVSGSLSVGYPAGFGGDTRGNYFGLVNVDSVVEAEATLIVGDNMPKNATSVTISVDIEDSDGNIQASSADTVFLVPEKGQVVPLSTPAQGQTNPTEDPADATKLLYKFDNVVLNTPYKMIGTVNGAAWVSDFSVDGSGIDYAVTIGTNEVDNAVAGASGITYDGTNVTFDSTYADVIYAATITAGVATTLTDKVDFTGENAKVAAPTAGFIAVLSAQDSSNQLYYVTSLATPAPSNSIPNGPVSPAAFTESAYSLETVKTLFELRTDYDIYAGAMYEDNFTFLVKGTVEVIYTNTNVRGLFEGNYPKNAATAEYNVNFEGAGVLIYGDIPKATATAAITTHPLTPSVVPNLNAAYYYENNSPSDLTYYYTTLSNALDNSNIIYIVGWIFVDEPMTFAGDNPDADTIIRINTNSGLVIGWQKSASNDPTHSDELVAQEVTVPETEFNTIVQVPGRTTVIKLGTGPSTGVYWVAFGQAVYDTEPTAPVNTPTADVLLEGAKYIYTDLWTALDITVSGDTINLLRDATLSKSGTLKAGVIFIDNPRNLTIAAGTKDVPVVFTVNGTVNSSKSMAINGFMTINGTVNFLGGAVATLGANGMIDVLATGVLNVGEATKAARINAAGSNGQITILGTMNILGTSTAAAGTVIIIGTANVKTGLTANDLLQVGTVPTLHTGYVNSAVIDGTVNIGGLAIVFGEFTLKTPSGFVSTKYMIGDILYATAYAEETTPRITSLVPLPTLWDAPIAYTDSLKDIVITDWNNNKVFTRGEYLTDNLGDVTVGEDNSDGVWTTVWAEWDWRYYDVTFANAAGVNWDAHATDGSWSNTSSSGVITGAGTFSLRYGLEIQVTAFAAAGYSGTPTVSLDGNAFTNGSKLVVTEGALFTSSNLGTIGPSEDKPTDNGGTGWSDPIVILLIIIIIIIAVIAIVVAAKLLRS